MLDIYTDDGLRGQAKLPILATLVGSKDSHFPNSDKFLWVYFLLRLGFFAILLPMVSVVVLPLHTIFIYGRSCVLVFNGRIGFYRAWRAFRFSHPIFWFSMKSTWVEPRNGSYSSQSSEELSQKSCGH